MLCPFFRSAAIAFGVSLAVAQAFAAGPNVSLTAAPSGNVRVANVPASIAGSGSWTSGCVAASSYRAFDVFAALAGGGTLQIQRYADIACTYPAGAAVPTSPLALATGSGCPSTTSCGDAGSNDGLPFLALKITLADTSTSTNVINSLVLTLGGE